ncbi:MAG: hypothetical protein KIT60_28360 [Burkholderiaceae bacterium]|nr:hypothetical protein [Burkholderiaceae bacterium]
MAVRILILAAAAVAALASTACTTPGRTDGRPGMMGGGMMGGGMMGGGMMGGGMMGGACADATGMMTAEERERHMREMRAAKTPEERRALMDKQHQQMVERAKERGQPMPDRMQHERCMMGMQG